MNTRTDVADGSATGPADPSSRGRAPNGAALPPPAVLIVGGPRGRTTLDRLIPVLLVALLCGTLLAIRAGLADWQGLVAESQERLTGPRETIAAAPEPAPAAPTLNVTVAPLAGAVEARPADAGESEAIAAQPAAEAVPQAAADEPALAEVAEAAEPAAVEGAAPGAPALAANAGDETKAALDGIAEEAARRKAERAELDRLRRETEANAPPPPPARRRQAPSPFDLFAGRIRPMNEREAREIFRRFEEMDRMMAREMEQAQREFFVEFGRGIERPRGFLAPRMPRPGAVPPPPPLPWDGGAAEGPAAGERPAEPSAIPWPPRIPWPAGRTAAPVRRFGA